MLRRAARSTMCVAMAESAPISLVTISCTMLASGPSSSRIVAAMWAKTDSGKHAIVSLCALMKSSSCATRGRKHSLKRCDGARGIRRVAVCSWCSIQKLGSRGGSDTACISCPLAHILVPTSARDTGCVLRGMQEDSHRRLHVGLGDEHEAAEMVAARVAVGDARTIHGFSHAGCMLVAGSLQPVRSY